MHQMRADAQAQAFDTLLVFRVDRLSRKVKELALLVDELTKIDVDLRSITEPFDTSNPAGKMMLQMLGVFAEFEHSTIIQRTKLGMLRKATTGSWPGGPVPFGYSLHKETGLEIVEDEAVIIRKTFCLYAEGREGSSAICDEMNSAGYRKRNGKKFDRKAVLRILRNPFYVGKFKWQGQVFDGEHDAIVSVEKYSKANEILNKRSAQSPGKNLHNQDEHILSSSIRCSKCKTKMVGVSCRKNGKKIRYYVCRKRLETKDCDMSYIRADRLEEQILTEVQNIFSNETLLAEIWQEAQKKLAEQAPNIEEELRHLEASQSKVQAKLDRYFTAFESDTMDPRTCNQRIQDLQTQLDQLKDEHAAKSESRQSLDLPAIKQDFINQILTNLKAIVGAVSPSQKKHLLHLLVKKVLIIDSQTAETWYRLPQESPVRTLSYMVPRTGLEPVLPA
jgi:site-specific DNA recombinase